MIDFIFLGDSLTFGYVVKPKDNWVHKLSEYLKLNILNKGVNGNTTTDMLFRFYEDVVSNSPKSLFIMGGTNDLLSNRPVSKIIENMEVMIKEAFAKNIKVIIGIPPVIDSAMAQALFMPSLTYDYCHKNLEVLRMELINLCNSYNLKYIDFYEASNSNLGNNILMDGIHFNPKGQDILFNKAKEVFILI